MADTTKMPSAGVTESTPDRIMLGAGVYAQGLPMDTLPTSQQVLSGIIGATNGGGKVEIVPEFMDLEIDGVLVKTKGMTQKVGETAKMETNMAEVIPEMIAKMVVGKVDDSTTDYKKITSKARLVEGDYYSGLGFVGQTLAGNPIMIIFKNALCTSGFSTEAKNKEQAVFSGTFECCADTSAITQGENLETLPYVIWVYDKEIGEMGKSGAQTVADEEGE
ncbi:MAG: hypothetical protein QM793_06775 [Muricomes sp.]